MSATVSPPPRVAVIVPAYGVAHLLGEALRSLQAQTLTTWECLVIDDGAPDNVATAVAPFLVDPRIRFVATANRGVSAARNRAIAETTAPYIALLDGDDMLRDEYLAQTVAVLDGDSQARLVTCNARIFGAVARERSCFTGSQGSGEGNCGLLADVLDRSFGVYIGTTFRRSDFDATGGFDTAMAQPEDFDFRLRLMRLRNIRVSEKALAELGDETGERPETDLVRRLIAWQREALAFEHAIDRIIDGDTRRGLGELRAASDLVSGPVWALAFSARRVFPGLARPLLRWRRRAHRRGGALAAVPDVAAIVPSLIGVA